MLNKIIVLSLLALNVSAKTIYDAQNGDTISANVAENSLTRIEVEGHKIIKDFSSANISKKISNPLGQVYLVPNTKSSFNLYVVSDAGNTYNLRLTPSRNAVGDSIIIKPAMSMNTGVSNKSYKSTSYVRDINYLFEIMYLNRDDSQYSSTSVNQPIVTYDGLDSVLLKRYSNNTLTGYMLLLKNISRSKILLTESEFYSDHTLAVAIENPELMSNKFTRVFIVKEGM